MNSRIKNTFKNLFSGVISRFINIILSFLTRTVFIHSLSAEYLGVNGLFSNILTVLSLAEMGFSTAMIYSLYRPLADNDEDKICKIMKLYKKIYFIIGLVVIILGFLIMPWLNNLISTKPNINNISFIYVLYVLNTGVSYFSGAYKKSLLMADQKQYVINFYVNIFYFVKSIIQILILIIFKNFIFYLISQIFVKIFENIFLAKKIDLKYPYILKKTKSTLEKDEIHRIFGDVKALFLTRVGHIMLSGTDNLIITKYIGLFEVGILSNYTLIIDSLSGIIGQITVAATASIGNYIASNDKNESYKLFKKWIFKLLDIFMLFNMFILSFKSIYKNLVR